MVSRKAACSQELVTWRSNLKTRTVGHRRNTEDISVNLLCSFRLKYRGSAAGRTALPGAVDSEVDRFSGDTEKFIGRV